MIHKRILDVADSRPSAEPEEIAEEIGSVSGTFVEQVFEEYGDPAADPSRREKSTDGGADKAVLNDGAEPIVPEDSTQSTDGPSIDSTGAPAEATESENSNTGEEPPTTVTDVLGSENTSEDVDPVTEPTELNERQRTTLRVVQRDPTATQEEVADQLDVTRATISKRVNDIAGFDWADRRAFVERLFEDADDSNTERTGREETLAELDARLSAIESRLTDANRPTERHTLPSDLAHKVVHACMEAEYVSEDEELELLDHLV